VVALAVEDHGCGIPAEELARVFEPFYRAESARRLGQAGVGLGLAVVRRIAETHGGTITAESEPGRGSRFVVRLPRAPAPDRAPAALDHQPEAAAVAPSSKAAFRGD
jgi:signal transduction histidine kinase